MLRNLLFSVLILASAGVCNAGLVITPSNLTPSPIIAGSTGTIDFLIRADSGTQLLDGFQARVFIAPVDGNSPVGGLIFNDPQSDPQLNDPSINSSYVFFGRSLSANIPIAIGTVSNGGATYTGADQTDNGTIGNPGTAGSPVTLDTTDKLLFRLELTGVTAGTYTLSFSNDASTAFYTNQELPVDTTIGAVTSGQVQVIVTAVPEPGTMSLVGVTLAGLAFMRRKRQVS